MQLYVKYQTPKTSSAMNWLLRLIFEDGNRIEAGPTDEWEPGRFIPEKFRVEAMVLDQELQTYGGTDVDASAPGSRFLFEFLRKNIGSPKSFRELWTLAKNGASLDGISNHEPLYEACFPGIMRWPTTRKLNSLSFIRDLRKALKSRAMLPSKDSPAVHIEPFMNDIASVIP
jgi:hypothetical protein